MTHLKNLAAPALGGITAQAEAGDAKCLTAVAANTSAGVAIGLA